MPPRQRHAVRRGRAARRGRPIGLAGAALGVVLALGPPDAAAAQEPRLTTSDPPRIELASGRGEVEVLLRGTALDEVTSVAVADLMGQDIADTRVRIVRRGPDWIRVIVSAGERAPVGTAGRLLLVTSTNRYATPAEVSVSSLAPVFVPVVVDAGGLVMIGTRFHAVTVDAAPLAMTGTRFHAAAVVADGLVMTGIRHPAAPSVTLTPMPLAISIAWQPGVEDGVEPEAMRVYRSTSAVGPAAPADPPPDAWTLIHEAAPVAGAAEHGPTDLGSQGLTATLYYTVCAATASAAVCAPLQSATPLHDLRDLLAPEVGLEHRDDPSRARASLTRADPLVAVVTIDPAPALASLVSAHGVVLERNAGAGWEFRTEWRDAGTRTFRDELARNDVSHEYRLCIPAGRDRLCSEPLRLEPPSH